MTYLIFYRKSDGKIFSYNFYNFQYEEITGEDPLLINKPTVDFCAENSGISKDSIGMKIWTIENPDEENFVDNINSFSTGEDIEEIE